MELESVINKKYFIKKKIGEGGYSNVYLVEDLENKENVALKVTKGEKEKDYSRFLKEIKILESLNHPNIISILETFEYKKMFCFTMKYIEDGSFDYFTKKSVKTRPKRIIEYIIDIAMGLDYAHNKGVIHRDIKPGNMLYDKKNKNAYITDFGLAKFESGKITTGSKQLVGTLHYLSPEQARGEKCTVKSDIYSLGASLYHMLTKETPFQDENELGLIKKIGDNNKEAKPIRKYDSSLPHSLETICMKALLKNPLERYESMAAFADDLRNYLDNKKLNTRATSRGIRSYAMELLKPQYYPVRLAFALLLPSLCTIFYWQKYNQISDQIKINEKKIVYLENKSQEFTSIISNRNRNSNNEEIRKIEINKEYLDMLNNLSQINSKINDSTYGKEIHNLLKDRDNLLKKLTQYDQINKMSVVMDFYEKKYLTEVNVDLLKKSSNLPLLKERIEKIKLLEKDPTLILKKDKQIIDSLKILEGNLDLCYKISLQNLIAKYLLEKGNEEFKKLFTLYEDKIIKNRDKVDQYINYFNNKYYPKISYSLLPSSTKVSVKLQNSLNEYRDEIRKWLNSQEKPLTDLLSKLKNIAYENENYRSKVFFINELYFTSNHIYSISLNNSIQLLNENPKSPLALNYFLDSIYGSSITKTRHWPMYVNEVVHRCFHYSQEKKITLEQLGKIYAVLASSGKKDDTSYFRAYLITETLKYLKNDKNKEINIFLDVYEYLRKINETNYVGRVKNKIEKNTFNYGTDEQKLIYMNLDFYYLKDKNEFDYFTNLIAKNNPIQYLLKEKRIEENSGSHIIELYSNYIGIAIKSEVDDDIKKAIEDTMPLFNHSLISYEKAKLKFQIMNLYNTIEKEVKKYKMDTKMNELKKFINK